MPQADKKPFPPGRYPVIVIGSGPGGLQLSYSLRKLGVEHAVISADEGNGGMFREYPFFQRLISWTKLFAPEDQQQRGYYKYDWNSLYADEPQHRGLVAKFMDGTSYFPSRSEIEAGLVEFAAKTKLKVRHGCRWEATSKEDRDFVIATSDGEYRCTAPVFAIGVTEPWKPDIPGIDLVPHYVETKEASNYAGKEVLIMGKRNSAFELADGLLPWARRLILMSPRPAVLSILSRSVAAARARYMQPYEDHVLGGGHVIIDGVPERIEKSGRRFRVFAKGTSRPGDLVFEVDEVIAATGFQTPLRDLPDLGVKTMASGKIPALTPWWESVTLPHVFFAGSATQGSTGLKKYGIAAGSGGVHGLRQNARVLAEYLAATHFGMKVRRPPIKKAQLVRTLLEEVTESPELWNQKAYLARCMSATGRGVRDDGYIPLAHFVDTGGPDAVAATVEIDSEGDIHPAFYLKRSGRVDELLLPSNTLHDFRTAEHEKQLASALKHMVG